MSFYLLGRSFLKFLITDLDLLYLLVRGQTVIELVYCFFDQGVDLVCRCVTRELRKIGVNDSYEITVEPLCLPTTTLSAI